MGVPPATGPTGVKRTRHIGYSLPDINYKLVLWAFRPRTYMKYDRYSTFRKIRSNCFSTEGKKKKEKKDEWR
jgi:hypothetical protein